MPCGQREERPQEREHFNFGEHFILFFGGGTLGAAPRPGHRPAPALSFLIKGKRALKSFFKLINID